MHDDMVNDLTNYFFKHLRCYTGPTREARGRPFLPHEDTRLVKKTFTQRVTAPSRQIRYKNPRRHASSPEEHHDYGDIVRSDDKKIGG